MKKQMLKKLKLGVWTYANIHMSLNYAAMEDTWSDDFSQQIVDILYAYEPTFHLSVVSDTSFWKQVLDKPGVIQIFSEKFSLTPYLIANIFSSRCFLSRVINISEDYTASNGKKISLLRSENDVQSVSSCIAQKHNFITRFVWKIVNRLMEHLNSHENIFLLEKHPTLWLELFNFVSERFALRDAPSLDFQSFRCSFPFSWLLYTHIKQLVKMDNYSALTSDKDYCTVLKSVLNTEENMMFVYLLKDFIQIAMNLAGSLPTALIDCMVHEVLSSGETNLQSFSYILSCKNILIRVLWECFKLEYELLARDLVVFALNIGHHKEYLSKVLQNVLASNFSDSHKVQQIEILEYICFHYINSKCLLRQLLLHKIYLTSGTSCETSNSSQFNAVLESGLPTYGSLLYLGTDWTGLCRLPFSLHEQNKMENGSHFEQRLFSVLFVLMRDQPSLVDGFVTAINKSLLDGEQDASVIRSTVKNIVHASNELSVADLTSLFTSRQELTTGLPFSDLLKKGLQNCTEKFLFTCVVQALSRKRLVEQYPQELLSLICSDNHAAIVCLSSSPHLKLLCVKSLVRAYGLTILNDIQDKASWLLENKSEIKQCTNLFSLVGDSYQSTRQAVLESNEAFEYDPINVMLTYFQQKTSGDMITEEERDLFQHCINKIIESDNLDALNKLDDGEMFGCSLESWQRNSHPLFLINCYITQTLPSNVLTKFLQYICKFPVRIKQIFLPTMREDVVSKFRETLGERFAAQGHQLYTWYQCAGGHVYAINNCGEPQEKGKCFCGGEIGGMKHSLSQGNRRLETYTFVEEGYNLPPIGLLSSIDSERNLKSLSLSFMRWMLHAALVSSSKINCCAAVFGLKPPEGNVYHYLQLRLLNDFEGIQRALQRNPEDTQIWMITAVKHIFSVTDDLELDYTKRIDRNKLEDMYLETITPLVDRADEMVSNGHDIVYSSGNDYIKQVLGLSYPTDGPGVLDVEEYLHFSKPITTKLEEQFKKFGSVSKYPMLAKYTKYKSFMHLLYQLPDLVKVTFSTLRILNNKATRKVASQSPLKNFVQESDLDLWNTLWSQVKTMPKFVDNIHIGEQYMEMKLTAESNITDFLPCKTGLGVCTWFMLNNLIALYNQFSSDPAIDIISLASFVTPPAPPYHEIIAITYDTYKKKDERFDFELLDSSLASLFSVKHRSSIDVRTASQLLFCPLKARDSWYKSLRQLPKEHCTVPPDTTVTTALLHSVEIAIQLATSPTYDTLTVEDMSMANRLDLPRSLNKPSLYHFWHQSWFQLSVQEGRVYIPRDSEGDVVLVDYKLGKSDVKQLQDKVKRTGQLVRVLHMLIVEWVVHYPGFNCRGMDLWEALDFYCEHSGVVVGDGVVERLPAGLCVEQSVSLWNLLCTDLCSSGVL